MGIHRTGTPRKSYSIVLTSWASESNFMCSLLQVPHLHHRAPAVGETQKTLSACAGACVGPHVLKIGRPATGLGAAVELVTSREIQQTTQTFWINTKQIESLSDNFICNKQSWIQILQFSLEGPNRLYFWKLKTLLKEDQPAAVCKRLKSNFLRDRFDSEQNIAPFSNATGNNQGRNHQKTELENFWKFSSNNALLLD